MVDKVTRMEVDSLVVDRGHKDVIGGLTGGTKIDWGHADMSYP